MLGLVYYLLCILVGFTFTGIFFPAIYSFTNKTYTGKSIAFPALFLVFPTALVTGTLLMVWSTYFLACLFHNAENPLTIANSMVMIAAAAFTAAGLFVFRKRMKERLHSAVKGINYKDMVLLCFLIALASFLMFLTFFVQDRNLNVGVSVFSDFAPHMGMIRSFSKGNNFPTSYSHFAGEDIKYHFLFQFLVGNLEYLGMRIDWAFNLPSILCFVGACMLLYTLAVKLFGKRAVGMLAVLFFLFRSGSALPTYISETEGTFGDIINALKENTVYIGKTLHEDWGLWNLNVYVNQRHLAFGMCIVISAVLLMLEPVFGAAGRVSEKISEAVKEKGDRFAVRAQTFVRESVFAKEGWLIKDYKTAVFCGVMLGLGAFFNGACVIACLLVLFVLAFVTDRRLEYLVTAVIAVVFSSLESAYFINGSVLSLRWEPGFLADVKNFFGTVHYLNLLLGILPIVIIAAFLIVNGYYKWILLAFLSPIIFAVTFQMTTDTAVNHKYIMIGCMLAGIFAAALVYKLYVRRGLCTKLAALLLIFFLTCTGVYDFSVLIKKNSPMNSGSLVYDINDPVTLWIEENADAEDIFLTDWYSLNNVVLGGAMLYYGWPYYAWSAGYDTEYREAQVKLMYEAENSEELLRLTDENNIRFIIVDNAARTNQNYSVREDVIAVTFECVYTQGSGERSFHIYDTQKR